jgi:hypothetical protein
MDKSQSTSIITSIFEREFTKELNLTTNPDDANIPFLQRRVEHYTKPTYSPLFAQPIITVKTLLEEYEQSFTFSNYDEYITRDKHITMLPHKMVDYYEAGDIENEIKMFAGNHVYARIDIPLPEHDEKTKYRSAQQIYDNFRKSPAITKYLNNNKNIVILQQVLENENNYHTIKCFVHNSRTVAITTESQKFKEKYDADTNNFLMALVEQYVERIIVATEIPCFTAIILIHESFNIRMCPMILLNIHNPAWLSGDFDGIDMENATNYDLFFGERNVDANVRDIPCYKNSS